MAPAQAAIPHRPTPGRESGAKRAGALSLQQAGRDLMAQARNAYAGRTDPNFGSFPTEALVPWREFLLTVRL